MVKVKSRKTSIWKRSNYLKNKVIDYQVLIENRQIMAVFYIYGFGLSKVYYYI